MNTELMQRCIGLPLGLLILFSVMSACLDGSGSIALAASKDRLADWKAAYGELSPFDHAQAKRAHDIFQRVLRAAGTRPGVEPRLLITQHDPLGISLPIAIPDGSIILSPKALSLALSDPQYGDDRLAFILGHEIAHQLKGDFWHMQFFQALESVKAKPPNPKGLQWLRNRLRSFTQEQPPQADQYGLVYAARELQADDYGIVYAAIAGFNPRAIVTGDNSVNFFSEWLKALNPNRLAPTTTSPLNPTRRAEAVKKRLYQIIDNVEMFHWGVRFYQVSDYPRAILAFRNFIQSFPSPEVYQNLALSHHQLALASVCSATPKQKIIPFKFTLTLEAATRASTLSLAGGQRSLTAEQQLAAQHHLNQAVTFYQRAQQHHPTDPLIANNLGALFLQRGEIYKAIATLQEALTKAPDSPEILNHLGVAFFLEDQPRKSRRYLIQARQRDPQYDAPLFNLGVMAYRAGRPSEAQAHWSAYLELNPSGPWADIIQQPHVQALPCAHSGAKRTRHEQIMGLQVHDVEKAPPPSQVPSVRTTSLRLEADALTSTYYPSGVMTLSRERRLQMIGAIAGYTGATAKGIRIGDRAQDVRQRYGGPARMLHSTQGVSWIYDTAGIAFQLQHHTVISWLLF